MANWTRCLGALVLGGSVTAQSAVWELPGPYLDGFGSSLVVLGDVTGDGLDDVAIGLLQTSKVRVRDGSDGSFLYTVGGQPGSNFSEALVALGDVDGDGLPDLGVGAPQAAFAGEHNVGEFHVLSGADGSTIRKHRGGGAQHLLGTAAVALGDVDLDGVPDHAFRRQPGAIGELVCKSGATGDTLIVLQGFDEFDDFARDLAAGGDIDLDGVGDLVVATRLAQPAPTVTAFSGAALGQSQEQILYHVSLLGVFGSPSLAMPGDLDGDGAADVALGVDNAIRTISAQGLLQGPLAERPYQGVEFAREVVAAGDLDGDGVGDLLATGADSFLPGVGEQHFVMAISGADGRQLFASVGPGWVFALGAGDFDGDDRRDVVASYRDFVLTGEHLAFVRAAPGTAGSLEPKGESCFPNASPPFELDVLGDPSPAGRLAVVMTGPVALQATSVLLLIGLPSAPLILPGGCGIHVAPMIATVDVSFPSTGSAWQSALAFDVPPTAMDISLGVQAVALVTPGQLVATDAAFVRIKN